MTIANFYRIAPKTFHGTNGSKIVFIFHNFYDSPERIELQLVVLCIDVFGAVTLCLPERMGRIAVHIDDV